MSAPSSVWNRRSGGGSQSRSDIDSAHRSLTNGTSGRNTGPANQERNPHAAFVHGTFAGAQPEVDRDECGNIRRIWLSARQRIGLESVRRAIEQHCLQQAHPTVTAGVPNQSTLGEHVAKRSAVG